MIKRLTLRIIRCEKMLVVEELSRGGYPIRTKHCGYDESGMWLFEDKIIFRNKGKKDKQGTNNTIIRFSSDDSREDYILNLYNWIISEQFKFNVSISCEGSGNDVIIHFTKTTNKG